LDGLDLTVYWFPSTEDSFLLPLKRAAFRSGVEIYSISVRTDMCQPTAQQREAQFADIKKWVDVAARLGAGHIRVFGGNVPKGSTERDAAGWVVETLQRSSEYAGSRGVILGLENHGGITEKAETILAIVKKVDSPWVGVNLDTGNFRTRIDAQVEMLLPYAVNVQLKADVREDGVSKPADWDRTLGMLAKSGYKGYVALEYESQEDPAAAVPRLSRKLAQMAVKYTAL
jgi:sugar phosphate isomerase/epimerase